jgi:hypothetical protein
VKLENLPEYSSVPIYKKHNILNRTFMRERERERERERLQVVGETYQIGLVCV